MCSVQSCLKANSHSVYFVCPRGKQKGQRQGFLWAAPRRCVVFHLDIGPWLKRHFIDNTAEALGFDIETRKKLRPKSILDTVRLAIWGVVPDGELAMLSSKSWPQMSITWAMLAEVPPATTVALGNWVDKPADTQRSEMPLRYTGFWRCVLRLFANGVTQPEKVLMWDELGHKLYVATRERSFDRASTVLQAKEVVFFTASSDEIHFQKANSLMQRIFHDSRSRLQGHATAVKEAARSPGCGEPAR